MSAIVPPERPHRPAPFTALAAALIAAAAGTAPAQPGAITAPTTLADFFGPGTQPETLTDPIESVTRCDSCHGGFDLITEPLRPWAASPMGQAQRDPIFLACLTIANQDAAFAGDLCLRCHTPPGWLAGRSEPTDGSALIAQDFEGINCNFCHRMVDPVYNAGVDPIEDEAILSALNAGDNTVPPTPHSGHYVVDPLDRRRGPFDLGNFNKHDWFQSPYHRTSEMCAMCHDVSNPAFSRQADNTYALNDLNTISPSHDTHEQFPIERTYSEWSVSAFAAGPVELGGRFGGNITAVSSCQDCHMPDATGKGCKTGDIRTNLPTHQFNGGNTWLLEAVRNLYPDSETFLSDQSVADSVARTEAMLRAAADLDARQDGGDVIVRVTNWSGHKLPSGYPEGRRMWLHVEFSDDLGETVAEFGHYDHQTAELTTGDTRVWETKLGISEDVATLLGRPAGEGFHFAINNVRVMDNRIPPLGFDNDAFRAIQSEPVGAVYADEQHWDEASFPVPPDAASVEVELYYQSVSLEYATFLLTENHTDTRGQEFWAQYLATGMSPPVEMGKVVLTLSPPCPADVNGDGIVDNGDIIAFVAAFLAFDPSADFTGDGIIDNGDIGTFVAAFLAGC